MPQRAPARHRGSDRVVVSGGQGQAHRGHPGGEPARVCECVANMLRILCGPDVGEELDDGEVVVGGGLVVEGVAGPAAGGHKLLPILPRHVVLPHQHLPQPLDGCALARAHHELRHHEEVTVRVVGAGRVWLAVGRRQHRVRGQQGASAEWATAASPVESGTLSDDLTKSDCLLPPDEPDLPGELPPVGLLPAHDLAAPHLAAQAVGRRDGRHWASLHKLVQD